MGARTEKVVKLAKPFLGINAPMNTPNDMVNR